MKSASEEDKARDEKARHARPRVKSVTRRPHLRASGKAWLFFLFIDQPLDLRAGSYLCRRHAERRGLYALDKEVSKLSRIS